MPIAWSRQKKLMESCAGIPDTGKALGKAPMVKGAVQQ